MKRFRKSIALLMTMALFLLPAVSLGEAAPSSIFEKVVGAGRSLKTTITFEPGEMLTQDTSSAGIADLLKALRLETVSQKNEAGMLSALDLYLQNNPVLSLTITEEQAQTNLMSNLLEKPVSFTAEEYLNLYNMMMEKNIAQMEQQDPSTAAMFKAYLEAYNSMMKGEMPKLPEFDQQSLEEDLFAPVQAWFGALMANPETTPGTYESDKHDTATVQVKYSLSASDITALLTLLTDWAAKDVNLDKILSIVSEMNPDAGDLTAIKDEIRAKIKAVPAGFSLEGAPSLPQPITLTLWQDDTGDIKAAELNADIVSPEGTESDNFSLKAGYYVKTEADGKNELVSFDAGTATDALSLSFSAKDLPATVSGSDTVSGSQWHFTMGMTEWGTSAFNVDLNFNGQKTEAGADIKDAWKLSLEAGSYGSVFGVMLDNNSSTVPDGADVRMDGKMDVYMTGISSPLASILYTTATGDPLEMPAIPEDSVHPGKMTMDELEAWGTSAGEYAQTQLMYAMQYLPPSVMTMLSGQPAY